MVIRDPGKARLSPRIVFKGFNSTEKGVEAAVLKMERCFIRHMTSLSQVQVLDGRGHVARGASMELSGKVISERDEARIMLVIHRSSDRAILYIDDFSLFAPGEEQCIRLAEWLRRKFSGISGTTQ